MEANMTIYNATETAYKNGYEAGKAAILKELMEVYDDLDKICDAASEGKVDVWHDSEGKVVETQPYEMTGNAFNDVCGLWQNIRMIFAKNGIQLP
jgi:hypothetical protein